MIPKASALADRAKELQGVLGDHQDLVVEAAFLRYLAARYGAQPDHNGFTYGLLMAGAEEQAAEIRHHLEARFPQLPVIAGRAWDDEGVLETKAHVFTP